MDLAPEQTDLFEGPRERLARRTLDLVRAMREVKEVLTSKEVAHRLDKSASEVDNALAARDRKAPPLGWVLALMEMDPDHRLLRWLADQVGCEVRPKVIRTTEEQLAALRQAVTTELGREAARVILRRAGQE